MTRFFLRLPGRPTVDAAIDHAPVIGLPVLDRGPDGEVRGSVELDMSGEESGGGEEGRGE